MAKKMTIGNSPLEQLKSQQQPQPEQSQLEQPLPEASAQPLSTSLPSDAPTHFDSLITDQAPGAGAAFAVAAPAPALLTREEFIQAFFGAFDVLHVGTKLESFKIQDGNKEAMAAAGAFYDTIIDIPKLHGLLSPRGKWWPRIIAIGMFTYPMGRAVGEEMRQRRDGTAPKPGGGAVVAAGPRVEGGPDAEQAASLGAVKH